MTKEELAERLNRTLNYPDEPSHDLQRIAKENNLVIVFGASDDLIEFRGAIYDERGCFEGGEFLVDDKGLLPFREEIYDDDILCNYFERKKKVKKIIAIWDDYKIPCWRYETEIPHVNWEYQEDNRPYCIGIIFSLSDL